MHLKQQPVFLAVISGGLCGLLMGGALSGIIPWVEPGKPYPFWAHFLGKVGDGAVAVAPGFFAGYLARRAGLWAGAVAGLIVPVAGALISSILSWPAVIESQAITLYFLGNLSVIIFPAAFTNGVAGLAGEYLGRSSQPSNLSYMDSPKNQRPDR